MDDIINQIHMLFHPLLDLDERYIEKENLVKREKIKFLTYNIFLRPPPVKNNESDWKDERLMDFIKVFDNFDIICLQEMFGTITSRRQELVKYANKSGLFFYVEVPSPSFFSKNIIDGGLLILSRFPIVESEFRPFQFTVLNCSVVEKGILYAKIKVKDSFIIIFNVHLQSTYFETTEEQWDIAARTRLSHIEESAQFIRETILERKITKNDRILLAGDFNIDAHGLKNKINKLEKEFEFKDKLIDEYQILIEKLNKNITSFDLCKNKFNIHPYTYGVCGIENNDTEKAIIYDMALTDKTDKNCHQTLDYIFDVYVNQNDYENQNENKNIQIDHDSVKIEEFLVEYKPYQQLSDHFGISVELNYVKK